MFEWVIAMVGGIRGGASGDDVRIEACGKEDGIVVVDQSWSLGQ